MMKTVIFFTFVCFSNIVLGGYVSQPTYYHRPQENDQYLAARPGETPACAKGGGTFCEAADNYPKEIIQYLLYKSGDKYASFFVDEDEGAVFPPPKKQGYGGGYEYQPPQYYGVPYNNSYTPLPMTYYQSPPLQQQGSIPQQYQRYESSPLQPPIQTQNQSPYYTPHTVAAAVPSVEHHFVWNYQENRPQSVPRYRPQPSRTHRQKREVEDGNQMCPVNVEYILPQAAMNANGTWMYVVNMDGGNTMVTQKVKTEKCAQTNCTLSCTFSEPGLGTKCEQLMIQKRLVALSPNGESLVNSLFWFPSCCVCRILNYRE